MLGGSGKQAWWRRGLRRAERRWAEGHRSDQHQGRREMSKAGGVCEGPPRWAKDPIEGSSRSVGPCSLTPAERPVIPEASAWQVVGKNPCANCTGDPWEPPSNPD